MSPWWLILIVPLSMGVGLALGGLLGASKRADEISEAMARAMEKKPPEAVTLTVTRYIPADMVMEKIFEADRKTAEAWLAVSMGQTLGPELVPYAEMRSVYRKETDDYQVTARVRVVPWEARK